MVANERRRFPSSKGNGNELADDHTVKAVSLECIEILYDPALERQPIATRYRLVIWAILDRLHRTNSTGDFSYTKCVTPSAG